MRKNIPDGLSQADIHRRREIVADYMARGIEDYTSINEGLIAAGLLNTTTGLPFTYSSIAIDKNWVRAQWAKNSVEKIDSMVDDIVAKSNKVFQLAIRDGDYSAAIAAMKSVRDLLDLDKPKGSRALKRAADERLVMTGAGGMTDAEAGNQAVRLDNTPAMLGQMLQTLRDVGAIDAALLPQTQNQKDAIEMNESTKPFPAANGNGYNGNGHNGNGH